MYLSNAFEKEITNNNNKIHQSRYETVYINEEKTKIFSKYAWFEIDSGEIGHSSWQGYLVCREYMLSTVKEA